MVFMDICVARRIRKLCNDYNETIWFNPCQNTFQIVSDAGTHPISIPTGADCQEIPDCIRRLSDLEYLRPVDGFDGVYFQVTPKLRHWFQFFLDSFTRKYFYGFISGIAATVIAEVLVACILSMLGIL